MASRELLTRVAYLYYERGLKQREISTLLGLSRSKVSRLLTEAEKCGIVEVRVQTTSSFSAAINWRQVADKYPRETVTIHVMMTAHSFTQSLVPLIPEFERLTGIKILYHILSSDDEYFRKLEAALADLPAQRLTPEQVERAWNYAYSYFHDYPRPFPWHLQKIWPSLDKRPLSYVLGPEGRAQYEATFQELAGAPIRYGQ